MLSTRTFFFIFQTTPDKNCGKNQKFSLTLIINVVLGHVVQGAWGKQHCNWGKWNFCFFWIRLCNAEKQCFFPKYSVRSWGFWIYQGCKYAQDSEYASGSDYVMVLHIVPRLYVKALNMPEYIWIIPGYDMPEYAWMCLNMSECFCFISTHSNSLSKGTIACFLGK